MVPNWIFPSPSMTSTKTYRPLIDTFAFPLDQEGWTFSIGRSRERSRNNCRTCL